MSAYIINITDEDKSMFEILAALPAAKQALVKGIILGLNMQVGATQPGTETYATTQ